MKKIILIFITLLFIGCAPTGVQVTFDDENSNTIREHLQHYVDGDICLLYTSPSPRDRYGSRMPSSA